MTADARVETCARCGHTTPDCDMCGQEWPFLGAGIGAARYCHTFVSGFGLSCYELAHWEWSVGSLDGRPWIHWPRDSGEVEMAGTRVTRDDREYPGDGTGSGN